MADADERAVILAYHEATKHSPVTVRTRAHYLDWDNRPFPFKFYTDLEMLCARSSRIACDTVQASSRIEPRPRSRLPEEAAPSISSSSKRSAKGVSRLIDEQSGAVDVRRLRPGGVGSEVGSSFSSV
jgi:hypothetical protein